MFRRGIQCFAEGPVADVAVIRFWSKTNTAATINESDRHSRFPAKQRLSPFTAGRQAILFVGLLTLRFGGGYLCQPGSALPVSQWPTFVDESDYRRLQRRFRPGFAPGSLVHPCGLVYTPQGHKKIYSVCMICGAGVVSITSVIFSLYFSLWKQVLNYWRFFVRIGRNTGMN